MSQRITTHIRRLILAHKPTETDSIAEFCRRHKLSRDSYYRIRNDENPLRPASTAPKNPHTKFPPLTWELIRQFRTELTNAGYDDGPRSIKWTLIRHNYPPHLIPSTSRIGQFLHDEQLTRLNPRKRPHSSIKRFQKEFANELWQLDGFEYHPTRTAKFVILQLIDDCTRLMLALQESPTGETNASVLALLTDAITTYGRPREILCDNARAFTLQRQGMIGTIDAAMAAQGIIVTPGPYYHPQNQGKIERAHEPVLNRLRATNPTTQRALRQRLDDFKNHYNAHRQHQSLGEGITPAAAWDAATIITPPFEPIDPTALLDRYTTTDDRGRLDFEYATRPLHAHGFITYRGHTITFGKVWEGHKLMIIDKGTHLEFYLIPHGELVATLDLPLTESRNINIKRHGRFIAGDNMRLPSGVEDRRKSTPVSDKSVPRLSDK
ncbi:DDE-type integrase/transposase/recombinase [Brevibacterium sp. S111]|uniref:integrase core domain-containing protein n=1 Tax=Brevibacterium sp. S111 TaxID=2483795 RepID=UPI0010804C9B|nr:DDE-type integrase/transposase/recombinase [Brevibacterium sp. S111]TGD08606.1 transposase [Brevibacterium sp. S111]